MKKTIMKVMIFKIISFIFAQNICNLIYNLIYNLNYNV